MLGFKSMACAEVILAGIEMVHMMRKRQARFTFNPCPSIAEQFFAKLKHWMRRAVQRSVETVHNIIANILDAVTPTECRNYVENAGYKST